MRIFEAIVGFRAAESQGDWFLAAMWLNQLEFWMDLQKLNGDRP